MEKIDILKQENAQLQEVATLSATQKVHPWPDGKIEYTNQIDVTGGVVLAKYLAAWINDNWKLVLADIKKNSYITLQTQLAALIEEAKGTLTSLEADVLAAKPRVDELIAERVALVELLKPIYETASQPQPAEVVVEPPVQEEVVVEEAPVETTTDPVTPEVIPETPVEPATSETTPEAPVDPTPAG